ncbi:MAG TPA: hybrid sensor histidine kinase/response regulator [Candidatus Omnitrophota bacterium]|nr:hybrid sensor histidine kinase/response regulator [Candidatus Omnitrophota bacterium]
MTKPAQKRSLLIVEENKTIQDLLFSTLNRKGYDVAQFESPRLALAKYHQSPADLVVTNIKFKDEDGIKFIEFLKRLDNDAAIILISAFEDFEVAQHAVAYGVYDLIAIPFDLDRIVRSVHGALEKKMLLERHKALIEKHIVLIEKLHLSYMRLKEIDKLKDDFLATISHELLTPLTVIKTLVYNLRKGVAGHLQGKLKDYIDIIQDNSNRLEDLLQQILNFSKLDAGRIRLDKEVLELGELVSRVVKDLEPVAAQKELALSFSGDVRDGRILADRVRLEEIVTNLIVNAVKFTPRRGEINVQVQEKGPSWMIQVKDTGFGIAPEHLDKIFTPFLQFNREQIEGRQGVGLGLAIVKKLVELHGGSISVNSRLGRGAAFVVMLPKGITESDDVGEEGKART